MVCLLIFYFNMVEPLLYNLCNQALVLTDPTLFFWVSKQARLSHKDCIDHSEKEGKKALHIKEQIVFDILCKMFGSGAQISFDVLKTV